MPAVGYPRMGRVERQTIRRAPEPKPVPAFQDRLGVMAGIAQVLAVILGVCAACEERCAVVDLGCGSDAACLEARHAQRFSAQPASADAA